MISDWLAAKLSGELADRRRPPAPPDMLTVYPARRPALLDMAGLRADMLSPIKETGTLLGAVTGAGGAAGGRAGTPVVMGGTTRQLGCLGLGVVRAGQTAVLGGTFWRLGWSTCRRCNTDPQMNIRVNPHVIPGMAQAESISFFTGLTMRWFRDAFCTLKKN